MRPAARNNIAPQALPDREESGSGLSHLSRNRFRNLFGERPPVRTVVGPCRCRIEAVAGILAAVCIVRIAAVARDPGQQARSITHAVNR